MLSGVLRSHPDDPISSIDVFVGNILALDNIPFVECLLSEPKCVFKALVVVALWFEALKIHREKLIWIRFVVGVLCRGAFVYFACPEATCKIALLCRKSTPQTIPIIGLNLWQVCVSIEGLHSQSCFRICIKGGVCRCKRYKGR